MKIKHKKGRHRTTPTRVSPFFSADAKILKWICNLPQEAAYDFPDPNDEDELDWSKLCGISFSPIINARKNSIMVGWRWNQEHGEFQLTPYWHDTKGKAFYAETIHRDVFVAVPDVDFEIIMDIPSMTVTLRQSGRVESYRIFDVKPSWLAREINTWFGGTDPAPKDFVIIKSKAIIV